MTDIESIEVPRDTQTLKLNFVMSPMTLYWRGFHMAVGACSGCILVVVVLKLADKLINLVF